MNPFRFTLTEQARHLIGEIGGGLLIALAFTALVLMMSVSGG